MASVCITGSLVIRLPNAVPLQAGGKRLGHLLLVTSIAGHSTSCLLFITDKHTGCHFLIDNGAEVSVIPPTAADQKHQQDVEL